MNNRIWIIGTAILSVSVIAMGWFLGISPKLAESALSALQRSQIDAQNTQYEAELAALKVQFESIDGLRGQLDAVRLKVPNNDESDLIYDELYKLAKKHNIYLDDLKLDEPIAYADVDPLAPSGGESAAPVDPVVAEEGDETAAPATPAATANDSGITSTSPLITPTNFYTMQISFAIAGDKKDAYAFLTDLRTSDRLFLINAVATKDGKEFADGLVGLGIGGLVYILNDGSDGVYNAGATEEEEVPTDTATPDPAATDAPVEEAPVDPTATETPAPTETPVP